AGGDGWAVATYALHRVVDGDWNRCRCGHSPLQHLLEQGYDPVEGAGTGQSAGDCGGHRGDFSRHHGAGSDLRAAVHRRDRPAAPRAWQPIREALAEGLFIDRAYRLGGTAVVLPLSRATGWVETRIVDAGLDLVTESVSFAGQPRRWLTDLRARQFVIGVLAGVVALAVVSMVIASRIVGKAG